MTRVQSRVEVIMLKVMDTSMVDRAVYQNSSSASEEDLEIHFSSPLDRRTSKIRVWGEMAPGEDPHSVSFSSKHQRILHSPYLVDHFSPRDERVVTWSEHQALQSTCFVAPGKYREISTSTPEKWSVDRQSRYTCSLGQIYRGMRKKLPFLSQRSNIPNPFLQKATKRHRHPPGKDKILRCVFDAAKQSL